MVDNDRGAEVRKILKDNVTPIKRLRGGDPAFRTLRSRAAAFRTSRSRAAARLGEIRRVMRGGRVLIRKGGFGSGESEFVKAELLPDLRTS